MSSKQLLGLTMLLLVATCFHPFAHAAAKDACSASGASAVQHNTSTPGNGQKCDPHFTYVAGPHGPEHWGGACNIEHEQSPIDILHAEAARLTPLTFRYQPVALNIFNDCNHYRVQVKFSKNYWLRVGKEVYSLDEFHFHEPGETAVKGERPRMVIHLVHNSSKSTLVVEVPVVVGKENPTIKTLWAHIPPSGEERTFKDVKINAGDLLPDNHSFYKFAGSLTTPECRQGITWYVLKDPIMVSEEQIAEYMTHYHNTARPLQPLNGRLVQESK